MNFKVSLSDVIYIAVNSNKMQEQINVLNYCLVIERKIKK